MGPVRPAHVLALVSLVAALAVSSQAAAADRVVERGIVQSITSERIVLRALDGSETTFRLGPRTRFRLNGLPAGVGNVRPGHVADVVLVGTGPVRVVRAYGRATAAIERGTIVSVGPTAVVLERTSGGIVTIGITASTAIRVGALRVGRRALRPGRTVEVIRTADGTARTIVVRRSA